MQTKLLTDKEDEEKELAEDPSAHDAASISERVRRRVVHLERSNDHSTVCVSSANNPLELSARLTSNDSLDRNDAEDTRDHSQSSEHGWQSKHTETKVSLSHEDQRAPFSNLDSVSS